MNTNNDIESFFYKNEEPKSLSKAQIGIKLIFHGTIKNYNELKQVMKLLNIL